MSNDKIRICYLPGRENAYVRTRVVLEGLKKNGFEVYDCSYPQKTFLRHFISFFKFLKYKNKSDIIFVGFLAQFLMPFVRLCTRKKIIFEAFISAYQTLAYDRKKIKPKGLLAKGVRWIERKDCLWADRVYLDTQEHINYFIREYNLPKSKFKRSWLSCDDTLLRPRPKQKVKKFTVHFHGEFQALHGTHFIIEAAGLCPDVQFQMVGKGDELAQCVELTQMFNITNVNFIGEIPYEQMPEYLSKADICLGIFGDTRKTQLVIPFKVFEGLAMAIPVISADTPAIKELLTHRKNVFLCEAANAKSLAHAIKQLQDDHKLRESIAQEGHKLFNDKCSPASIGADIYQTAKEILNQTN